MRPRIFDAESEDYKEEVEVKVLNYNRLLQKAGDKELDFALTNRIVETDRDADRRYLSATRNIEKGELYPQSSPMMEPWAFRNDDAESHEALNSLMQSIKASSSGLNGENKRAMGELVA